MKKVDLIKNELIRLRNEFISKDENTLKKLDGQPLTLMCKAFNKEYPIMIWSESEPDDSTVLIIEATQKKFFYIVCHREGFRITNNKTTILTEEELWEYD